MPVTHPDDRDRLRHQLGLAFDGPVLRVSDLAYSYPDGREALVGITFSVAQGERVALVGPNGAGKSTLLLQLTGMLRGRGGVEVCGMDVTSSNLGAIRSLVGMVFQDADDQLFSPTVFEDVAFGPLHMGYPLEEVQRRVREALAAVGMSAHGDRLSHHLSMGEKRRAAMATVLSMSPVILVLDEPSAGLDPRGRRMLIDLLRSLPQTMLVATHDIAMVRDNFARTIVMDDGRIAADGPTADIFGDRDLLEVHGLTS